MAAGKLLSAESPRLGPIMAVVVKLLKDESESYLIKNESESYRVV